MREMSVLENVMLAHQYIHAEEGILPAVFCRRRVKHAEDHAEEKAVRSLRTVGLIGKQTALGGTLSHGQRKLLELARAISSDASLMLLDEPAAGVFPETREKINKVVRALAEAGKTVLFIEHDLRMIHQVSDRVIVLNYGRMIADGRPNEVMLQQNVVEAYLGLSSGAVLHTESN